MKNATIVLLILINLSCKKESSAPSTQGQVEISFSFSALKQMLASTTDTVTTSGCYSVIVTIEDEKGKAVKNAEKIEIFNMNGSFISKPLSLLTGNYSLTRFLIVDRNNDVLYASPLKNSTNAALVRQPLPISFAIKNNKVVKITPEVISVVQSKPEDFGYATFGLNIAETFDFLVGVFVYSETAQNFELTSASLSVLRDSTVSIFNENLTVKTDGSGTIPQYNSIGVTNKVTLPERYPSFTLIISKPGFQTYRKYFSKEELRTHYSNLDKGPLVITLNKSAIVVPETVTDYDGNVYHTVTIGTQVWMKENLKTTHYQTGEPIPNVTDGYTWHYLTSGAYCYYGNNTSNIKTYGLLYNGYAVTNNKKLCPSGWHIPSESELLTLVNYLGGTAIAGGKMKTVENWSTPNVGASNSSQFSALPGGYRRIILPGETEYGKFANSEWTAYFWTSQIINSTAGLAFYIMYNSEDLKILNNDRVSGYSVRCIKD